MSEPSMPTLDAFLAAEPAALSPYAPETLIFAPGGTRRSAVLAGIAADSEEYPAWSRGRMVACLERIFAHGVRNIVAVMLRPAQLAEVGRYRERLFAWLAEGLAGPAPRADYARLGWRARIVGADEEPLLAEAAARLRELPAPAGAPTVWFYLTASDEARFAALRRALSDPSVRSRADALRLLYGEALPPATMLLSFGKPIVATDIVPPLLDGELQCYWTQSPGFELDEPTLRHILYDYAVLRRTWRQDKIGRYGHVLCQRELWERSPALVLGLGRRLDGGFWYPEERTPLCD